MDTTSMRPRNDDISSANSTSQDVPLNSSPLASGILGDEVLEIMTFVNYGVITAFIFVFGTIANIINAVVYYKIGFKESINISLEVLAISDLGCCFSLFMFAICFNPLVRKMDLPFDPQGLGYFPGWVHIFFSRITSLTTALITLERCMCIVTPLHVKRIVTPKRVTLVLACMVAVVLGTIAPHFFTAWHDYRFDTARNKSILVLVFAENHEEIDSVLFIFHSIALPIPTMLIVIISTIGIVVSLKKKTKWRENTTTSTSANVSNTRDAKVSQMVLFIATVFIVCYLPITISYITTLFETEFYLKRRYHNVFYLMFSFNFVLQATNSCFNIFIYYRMSSAYKAVFLGLFGRHKANK